MAGTSRSIDTSASSLRAAVPGLFVGAVFASALLLFAVQPMVSKRILAWFGGTPAVWTTCLVFFQTTLFAGYAYAHFSVSRWSRVPQHLLHAALLLAALLSLPVLPDAHWRPEAGRRRKQPTVYYGRPTGIGLVMGARGDAAGVRAGFVGLGIGTLAAYGRDGDRFRFYEINPAVIGIAQDPRHFTYLRDSAAEVELVEGDARLVMEAELRRAQPQRFDLLVLDAFSSDAIPVHLLTREAFGIYDRHLEPEGIIAIHATNNHLVLAPVLFRLGRTLGMEGLLVRNARDPDAVTETAEWVLLSRDASRLHALVGPGAGATLIADGRLRVSTASEWDGDDAPLWTDAYTNLFQALR